MPQVRQMLSTTFLFLLIQLSQQCSRILALKSPIVRVYSTINTLSTGLCNDFLSVCRAEIALKGVFNVAVPGGSVLKMLGELKTHANEVDWSKVNLFYVNHKCVPDSDSSSTHSKAKVLFLNNIPQINAFSLSISPENNQISDNSLNQASIYSQKLKDTISSTSMGGFPVFDYMLLGAGKDGHIGSLYPDRLEVLNEEAWVMSVDKVCHFT